MQSLADLNSISVNSVTFDARANISSPEGLAPYSVRVPSWAAVRSLGNLDTPGITVSQQFSSVANAEVYSSLVFSSTHPDTVTYSLVGNTATFGNICSVEDYLLSQLIVTPGVDTGSGVIAHLGNVLNTNSGNSFEFQVQVNIVAMPEFTPSTLSPMEYRFFGNSVSDLGNLVTVVSVPAPRIITQNQGTATRTLLISLEDPNTSISLNTTSSTDITKIVGNVGTVTLSLEGSIANINAHLGTLQISKFANTDIQRLSRQITYELSTAASGVIETVSGRYWSEFRDPDTVPAAVTQSDASLGSVYKRADYSYNTRIAFAGTHDGTGEPRWAMPMLTAAGNAAVKIYGQRLSSGSLVPGPFYDLGTQGGYTMQAFGSFETQANTGSEFSTGSTVTQMQISAVNSTSGAITDLGCDAGDISSTVLDLSTGFNQLFAYGSTRLVTGNLYGDGTTHGIQWRDRRATPVATNRYYSGTDWYHQYTMFPIQWGINQLISADDYDLVVKGVNLPGDDPAPVWPYAAMYTHFGVRATTKLVNGSLLNLKTARNLMYLNGQQGRLSHVCLTPRQSGVSTGIAITLWRGLTTLDNSELQHIVSVSAVAHTLFGTSLANVSVDLNESLVTRDHLAVVAVPSTGTDHQISDTYAGNIVVSLSCTNTQMVSYTGVSTADDYTPELFVRRGQTTQFTILNTSDPVIITNEYQSTFPYTIPGVTNNNISSGVITLTPTADTPDHLYYRSTQSGHFNRGHIWVYDGDPVNNNARWGNIVPGAVALVRGGADFAYMFYTKYTGSRTEGSNCSAGLYYRRVTANSDSSLTWGNSVLVQDPAQTGSVYGVQMSANSTVINGVTYVICSIMPRAPSTMPATPTVVGVRITN